MRRGSARVKAERRVGRFVISRHADLGRNRNSRRWRDWRSDRIFIRTGVVGWSGFYVQFLLWVGHHPFPARPPPEPGAIPVARRRFSEAARNSAREFWTGVPLPPPVPRISRWHSAFRSGTLRYSIFPDGFRPLSFGFARLAHGKAESQFKTNEVQFHCHPRSRDESGR